MNKHKDYEKVLKKNLKRQSLILRSLPIVLYTFEFSNLCITWINGRVKEITGFNASSFTKDKNFWFSRIHPFDKDLLFNSYENFKYDNTLSNEYRWLCADDEYRWFFDSSVLIRTYNNEPREILGVLMDITKRKNAESELKAKDEEIRNMSQHIWQVEKLATIGELSASIAHELNNPLAIINLHLENLQDQIPKDDLKQRSLLIIEQELDRMANLISNLLQFSRRGEYNISSTDLKEEINKTLDLIYYYIHKRNIIIKKEFSEDIPLLLIDRQKIRQIFLNLFTNSADAMEKGGIITIKLNRTNEVIIIEIIDTGTGIMACELIKVMEPFYTTKPEGKGTGLGLSICRRIVKEHHGKIYIESDFGKGTTVKIELPINRLIK